MEGYSDYVDYSKEYAQAAKEKMNYGSNPSGNQRDKQNSRLSNRSAQDQDLKQHPEEHSSRPAPDEAYDQ